ncbi:hypothetical protein GXW82_10195 [Streptacidiphilus sp. 4-A2]|nr:hypothetical protein [Streptacidiphilus sp. 4-A2]
MAAGPPQAALAVGGGAAVAAAAACGLPVVAVPRDVEQGAALTAGYGGRVVVCLPTSPGSPPAPLPAGAPRRSDRSCPPAAPSPGAARGPAGGQARPAPGGVLGLAEETGTAVRVVRPWHDDVLRGIAGAAVVYGPDSTALRDLAALWGRFAVLAPGTGPSAADRAADYGPDRAPDCARTAPGPRPGPRPAAGGRTAVRRPARRRGRRGVGARRALRQWPGGGPGWRASCARPCSPRSDHRFPATSS